MARLAAALALFLAATAALAWPDKPVRVVVPYAAGSLADTLARLVARKLAEQTKASFAVENREGGETAAAAHVAKAAPDGYTLLVSDFASLVVAPLAPRGAPYDPLANFTHVALFGGPPAVLVVGPGMKAKDLRELVLLARAKPGGLSYGSPGVGTQGHLVAELFKQAAHIEMKHVAYLGAPGAVADLVAGNIPVVSTSLATAAPQIRAGKVRALAISSATRLAEFPDLATYAELGYPELVATAWFSLSGPAKLAPEVVERLNWEVNRALDLPDVRERLKAEGIVPPRFTAREASAFVAEEIRRWRPIVRASGK